MEIITDPTFFLLVPPIRVSVETERQIKYQCSVLPKFKGAICRRS